MQLSSERYLTLIPPDKNIHKTLVWNCLDKLLAPRLKGEKPKELSFVFFRRKLQAMFMHTVTMGYSKSFIGLHDSRCPTMLQIPDHHFGNSITEN